MLAALQCGDSGSQTAPIPSRLDPSARRVEGGLADTRAEGESMSAEGSESACLKWLKDCLFPS